MFKLVLEKAAEPEIKVPCARHTANQSQIWTGTQSSDSQPIYLYVRKAKYGNDIFMFIKCPLSYVLGFNRYLINFYTTLSDSNYDFHFSNEETETQKLY